MNGVHGTNSQSLRKPDYSSAKRMIFNPLEKVFPRKFTDPGVRLQTSTDFNKHALEKTNALVSFDSHSIIRSNGLRNKVDTTPRISPNKKDSFNLKGGPYIKMANHMPLSAKHATSTPIKVFVNVGDHMGLGGRKSSAVKGANDSHDRDTKDMSGFLIKKPTAAMVNLKLDKGLASTRGASFERDPKSSALAKIDLLNNRRRSSRGVEQSSDSIANRKEKPYVSNEFFGPIPSSAKRDLDSSSRSKVKLASPGLVHVDLEKENWRKASAAKSKVGAQPVGSIFSKGSSTSLKTKLPPTVSTSHVTHKPPALTNIVTQVGKTQEGERRRYEQTG